MTVTLEPPWNRITLPGPRWRSLADVCPKIACPSRRFPTIARVSGGRNRAYGFGSMAIASIGIMYGAGGSSIRFPSASDELVIQMVSEATTAIFPTVGSRAIVAPYAGGSPSGTHAR